MVQNLPFVDKIVVAASDTKIIEYALQFPRVEVAMISGVSCGSEKVYRYFQEDPSFTYYLSIPADEPAIDAHEFNKIWPKIDMEMGPQEIATLYARFYDRSSLENPLSCKIAATHDDHALYFSRNIIPVTKSGHIIDDLYAYRKHVAIFVFTGAYLEKHGTSLWSSWPSPTQEVESLEQNRYLDYGTRVKLFEIKHDGFGIDCPEQIKQLEKRVAKW